MQLLTVLDKSVVCVLPAGTVSWISPTVSTPPPLTFIICLLLWSMLLSRNLPCHIRQQVINVTLVHQRIIKYQVMPWQRNVMAESQWCGGGVVRAVELLGGRACWEGSMAHLTPACPLLNQARPVTALTHSPPGNEVVQLLQMSVHSQKQPRWLVDVWKRKVMTKCVKFTFCSQIKTSLSGIFPRQRSRFKSG